MMKVVLYDPREDSPTKGEVNEFFLGEHNPMLVQIPPLVYHGFKCISDARRSSSTARPSRTSTRTRTSTGWTRTSKDIPYDWARKDG